MIISDDPSCGPARRSAIDSGPRLCYSDVSGSCRLLNRLPARIIYATMPASRHFLSDPHRLTLRAMGSLGHIHASCVSREGAGVLLLGPPGSGKSDLALRLLSRGFALVADDQVVLDEGLARPAPALAGLLEVRGLGIVRVVHAPEARLVLAIELGASPRLPEPRRHPELDLPLVAVEAFAASAPDRVVLALDCALGRVSQIAGAFAP
jgi:HPr kinase/phosphorylase